MPSNGVTISVTAETNAGGRKHMEDYIAVNLCPNDTLREIPDLREQAYIGVFDGHGGKEAAKYAREELWECIQSRDKFLSHDVSIVKDAIREAYLELHEKMLEHRPSWQPNKTGDLSTAGTTASTVIFRKNHIFVANVGDSTAIMGIKNPHFGQPGEEPLVAQVITRDHKPDDPVEQRLIRKLGGEVALSPKGVMRVVWERSRCKPNGCTEVDRIPFLSVARSLGDYWSFNPRTEKYTISPDPDVSAIPLNLSTQKFVVIASDGLWNVMTPNEVVSFIHDYQSQDECHQPKDVVSALIREALHRWNSKRLQADNIAVLIAFLSEEEPDGSTDSGVQSSCAPLKMVGRPLSTSLVTTEDSNYSSAVSSRSSHSPTPLVTDVSSLSNGSPSLTQTPSLQQERSSPVRGVRVGNDLLTTVVELETKMKVKKRKHKKHRRHGLERELARRGLHGLGKSISINHSVMHTGNEDTTCIQLSSDQEFSMFGSVNGFKRPHPPELDSNEEDEGILIPSSQKRSREDESVISLTDIRSQRLSTDTTSDSGSSSSSSSSGVSSDSNVEEGLPDSSTSVDLIMEVDSGLVLGRSLCNTLPTDSLSFA